MQIAIRTLTLLVAAAIASLLSACATAHRAITIGYGANAFDIGEVLYDKTFTDPNDWEFQIQTSDSAAQEKIAFKDGMLDIYMPDRGATAWLTRKFEGPITITYRVRCPADTLSYPDIQARDINSFWHASDPQSDHALFDRKRYTGEFTTYNTMHGYYASTGGGGNIGNHTTRTRRYPRNDVDKNPVAHIALTNRDDQSDYLITPGKWHRVQLVAFNDIIQYIVDDKVVYEYKAGDEVAVELGNQPPVTRKYTLKEFPAHLSGYFGLRLVKSHHQYADLTVYRLTPKTGGAAEQ